MAERLVVAITGASGMLAAKRLIEKSPIEVSLVASEWGRHVYERECGSFEKLAGRASEVFECSDLAAAIASGSVPTAGMVILPCSVNTLGQLASGTGQNLVTRAAHCQLKERRPLVLCLREAPLTLIDLENAQRVAAAGGVIMPLSPPFFMTEGRNPEAITMVELIDAYVDRVLKLFNVPPARTWEHVK